MFQLTFLVFLICTTQSEAYSAEKGVIPYIVSLKQLTNIGQYAHFCSGTILEAEWILTAAHCLTNRERNDFIVVAGSVNLSKAEGSVSTVSTFLTHPQYDPNQYPQRDIALVKLAQPVDFRNFGVEPVCTGNVGFEETVEVSGWVPNEDVLTYSYLNTTRLCSDNKAFICAIPEQEIVCNRDSGSPLVSVNTRRLVGVNLGTECNVGGPQIFTRIAHYQKWIRDVTRH